MVQTKEIWGAGGFYLMPNRCLHRRYIDPKSVFTSDVAAFRLPQKVSMGYKVPLRQGTKLILGKITCRWYKLG